MSDTVLAHRSSLPYDDISNFLLRSAGKNVENSVMVDIDAVRPNWRSRGFGCDVWTDPPGQTWEDYRHAVDELVMVVEGEVEFEIGGEVLQPTVGQELVIPAGVIHSVRNIGKTTSRWLYGYKTPS